MLQSISYLKQRLDIVLQLFIIPRVEWAQEVSISTKTLTLPNNIRSTKQLFGLKLIGFYFYSEQ